MHISTKQINVTKWKMICSIQKELKMVQLDDTSDRTKEQSGLYISIMCHENL